MGSRRKQRLLLQVAATDRTFEPKVLGGERVLEGKCIHCQKKLTLRGDGAPINGATLEHIVPKNHGGSEEPENLAIACARCNSEKGLRHDHKRADDPKLREVIERLQARRRKRLRIDPGWIVGLALGMALACGGSTSGTSSVADASSNTPAENRAIARQLIRSEYARWDNTTQLQCLDELWQAESHWNHRARNKRSGACGIPQAYPCSKMRDWGKTYGVDHRTNPWPQIAWGLRYIDNRYGTPCRAWQKFKRGGGY